MKEEQKREFISLACQLEPENLYCDGELTRSQALVKRDKILKRWKALEKEVGQSVDRYEVFNW